MAKLLRERFSRPADEFAARFVASVEADERLVPHDLRGSLAHARMLRRQGLLSEEDAAAIEQGLARILREWEEGSFRLDVAYEDVHMNVEKRLTDLAGAAGARLHTARSRNDQVAVDLRLWVRDAGREILEGLAALRRALARRAREHAATLLPGVTHLQRAQPVSFGHVLLCYHDRLARDAGRFEDALRRADVSPLGACALAGTSLPIDPAFTARELGFSRAFENSIDAVSDRDFAVEFTAAAALLAAHLSQMAEDFIVWSAPEFGFIELPDELCTSSSIMPQKKNPDMIELVRGKAAGVTGQLVHLLGTLKGLAAGYNRDLQETKPPVFAAAETARLSLRAMLLAVEGLRVNADRMLRAAEDPQILATDLAEYLAARGVPFREAHGAVARLMKHCAERGISPAAMPLSELRGFAPAFGEDVYALLSPQASAAAKTSPGGTAPALVAARAARLLGEPAP
ncbi:MAG TPA: argininosuccinate lyase [Planctomycetota bacterium]|jgi:argininosuccinate lyase|nr:argininosuccinate lyase [Planctomycetota bacterium]